MVIVDEAWGGHLHFHDALPTSAMASGADVAVQSTHKLAGGLQQTGLIHWRTRRVDSELMEEAYREYVTTSPSYHLLASADAAVRTLVANGEEALGTAIRRTRELKEALRERLPGPRAARRPRLAHADDRPRLRHGPRQDDARARPLRRVGIRRRRGADRARDRHREGGREHADADHDVPARPDRGGGDGRRADGRPRLRASGRATRGAARRRTRSARWTTGR